MVPGARREEAMKITVEWLKAKSACAEGILWFNAQKETDAVKVIHDLISDDKLDWANWLIVRVMERKQYLASAIYAAEQVLDIFEKKYPDDKRPRKAIEAAKAVLANDTKENRNAAAVAAYASDAASDAASAAASAAAAAAAAVAAYAAYAAAYASDAAYAAYAAAAAYVKKEMKLKILRYGMELLK